MYNYLNLKKSMNKIIYIVVTALISVSFLGCKALIKEPMPAENQAGIVDGSVDATVSEVPRVEIESSDSSSGSLIYEKDIGDQKYMALSKEEQQMAFGVKDKSSWIDAGAAGYVSENYGETAVFVRKVTDAEAKVAVEEFANRPKYVSEDGSTGGEVKKVNTSFGMVYAWAGFDKTRNINANPMILWVSRGYFISIENPQNGVPAEILDQYLKLYPSDLK